MATRCFMPPESSARIGVGEILEADEARDARRATLALLGRPERLALQRELDVPARAVSQGRSV